MELIKLKFLVQQSEAEMSNIEQMTKILPLITCEILFCQYVCKLMLGVEVTSLNLRIQVSPVKQPIKSNSVVLDTCLIVGLLPLIIILITASSSSKTYNIAPNREKFTFECTLST